MATTGFLNGTSMLLFVDGTAIGGTTSHSMSKSANMRDTTTKDSGAEEEVLPGLRSRSITFDGFVAWDASFGFEELDNLIENGTKVVLRFTADITGDAYFIADAFLESLDFDAPTEDNITFSGTFRVTGGMRRKTFT